MRQYQGRNVAAATANLYGFVRSAAGARVAAAATAARRRGALPSEPDPWKFPAADFVLNLPAMISGIFMLRNRYLAIALIGVVAAIALPHDHAGAVPAGQACGAGALCDKGLWCEPKACASQAGVCVAVPRLCIARKKTKSFQPVCGCNSKTYSNDCFRRAYKTGKWHEGKC
jgi:hypothetical protein